MCVRGYVCPISEPVSQSKPTTERSPADRRRHSRGCGEGGCRSRFTWFVYLKPESVFRLAYKVWGATPVLPGVFLCHVGQFQLSVGLSVFTDNTLQREKPRGTVRPLQQTPGITHVKNIHANLENKHTCTLSYFFNSSVRNRYNVVRM